MAGVTQAAEGLAGRKQLDLREGEATWIGQANPHARHGVEATMTVGANDGASRALIRFDLTTRMAYGLCGEQFGGSLYTDPKTGEVFFYGAGQNNVPVYRITGWDGWTRKSGTVELKP